MKWEYTYSSAEAVNQHGELGWEAVGMTTDSEGRTVILMKRPLVTADDIKLEVMQPVPEEAQAEVAAFLAKMARRQP